MKHEQRISCAECGGRGTRPGLLPNMCGAACAGGAHAAVHHLLLPLIPYPTPPSFGVRAGSLTRVRRSGPRAQEARKLWCLCRQPYNADRPMLACDYCSDWFHWECVGLDAPGDDEDDEDVAPPDFRCPACCAKARPAAPPRDRCPTLNLPHTLAHALGTAAAPPAPPRRAPPRRPQRAPLRGRARWAPPLPRLLRPGAPALPVPVLWWRASGPAACPAVPGRSCCPTACVMASAWAASLHAPEEGKSHACSKVHGYVRWCQASAHMACRAPRTVLQQLGLQLRCRAPSPCCTCLS